MYIYIHINRKKPHRKIRAVTALPQTVAGAAPQALPLTKIAEWP